MNQGPKNINVNPVPALKIIWLALCVCLVVYVAVGLLVPGANFEDSDRPGFMEQVRLALIIAASAAFAGSFFVRKLLIERARSTLGTNVNTAYVGAVIVSLAMSESIGIMGLVLKLLGDPSDAFYYFISASAFALFLNRPQKHQLEEL